MVVPGTLHPVGGAIEDVRLLLERYGLIATIDPGVRHGNGVVPRHDDVQILVVFVMDGETQALCQELAAARGPNRRLLACVPDIPENTTFQRVLQLGHGVEVISFPPAELSAGVPGRLGADVALACMDELVSTCAARRRAQVLSNTYVFILHGIRTRAPWLWAIRETMEQAGVVPLTVSYGYFTLLRFLTPFHWTKADVVARVGRRIKEARSGREDGCFVVLAHSFGSYIIGRLLLRGMTFRRVVLCGSILKQGHPFANGRGAFVNDVGGRDIWPIMASKVSGIYGNSGSFGFNNSDYVRDRFHPGLHHSDFLNKDFASRYWVPWLCHETKVPNEHPCEPTWWLRLADRLPRISYLLGLGGIYGLARYFGYV